MERPVSVFTLIWGGAVGGRGAGGRWERAAHERAAILASARTRRASHLHRARAREFGGLERAADAPARKRSAQAP